MLNGIAVSVAAGECLALVGRSGSGKTTLGRCLAGLHRTYEGTVLLDGARLPRSLRSRSRAEMAAVQYVFQDAKAAFDEHRPVLGQVARSAVRLRGATPEEARGTALRTLGEFGLDETLAGRRPGELSGGELQRAALARALLARPQVLICDEIPPASPRPRGRASSTPSPDSGNATNSAWCSSRTTWPPQRSSRTGSRSSTPDTSSRPARRVN